MSKKRQKEEFVDSLNSLIISYTVEIEETESRVFELRKERAALRKRVTEEI